LSVAATAGGRMGMRAEDAAPGAGAAAPSFF
jgi:hypothetical protein